jgi:hypothetical protein
MPDADSYRSTAAHLRSAARSLDEAAVSGGSAIGGPLGVRVDSLTRDARMKLARAVDELHRLAAVCERRAAICDDFASAMARYERLGWEARRLTPAPVRPAHWVER